MNISRPSKRFWYWLRSYYLRWAPEPEAYLKFQAKAHLNEPSVRTEASNANFLGSLKGATTLSLAVLLVWSFFVYVGPCWPWIIPDQAAEYAGTLWQVQAALLSVGFVVIVLLMQVIGGRDRLDSTLFGEYVRRSYILPVALLGLSTIAVMGATDLAQSYDLLGERTTAQSIAANFSLLLLNLFGIGYVYQRVIRLIRPGYSVDLISNLLKVSLQSSIHQQILNALGEMILNKKAGKYGFDYSVTPPRQGSPTEVEYPAADKTLRVVDVDLNKLRNLANSLESLNYTGPKGWFRARPGSTLSPSDQVVGYLQADSRDFAHKSFAECYVVAEDDDGRNQWEESVQNLRSRATRAIEERKPSELSEFLDVYEEVLRHYSRYIGEYNSEVIEAAFSGLMSGYWKPDSVLLREIRNLGRRAILADDRDLVEDFLYHPIKVLRTARTENHLELFGSFAKLYLSFYEAAQELPVDSTSREYIVDRCWRHLRDFANWKVSRSFDRVNRPHDIIRDARYAAKTLEVFSDLIKRTLNHQDYDSFHTLSDKFDGLMKDLPSMRRKLRSERLRIERETDEETAQVPETLEAVKLLSGAEDAIDELLDLKQVVRFGLAAWILDLYSRNKIKQDLAQRLIENPASHFTDLEGLHNIYLETRENEWEERFNWSTWDRERHGKVFGEVHAVTTRTWLRRFYVVKGIELISPEKTEEIDLSPSRQVRFEFEDIKSVCEEISEHGHPLRNFEDLADRIEAFLHLLEEAKERQERLEADQLIEADLLRDRVESFKEECRESWQGANLDRLIVRCYPKTGPVRMLVRCLNPA
jgi:hypothetical protein